MSNKYIMSKYINADEARNRIMDNCGKYLATELDENGEFRNGILTALNAIVTMPAADVVEVVRCKDCKYGIENGKLCGRKVYLCSCMTNPNEFYEDFYCESGERRTEDE